MGGGDELLEKLGKFSHRDPEVRPPIRQNTLKLAPND